MIALKVKQCGVFFSFTAGVSNYFLSVYEANDLLRKGNAKQKK